MERAARRFASWVLGTHVLLFLALVGAVAFASREFYVNARTQALDQVRIRQELLAAQAARGIEGFYRSIIDDLDLRRRAGSSAKRDVLVPLIWEQLRGRASRLFEIDGTTPHVVFEQGDDQAAAKQLLDRVTVIDPKTPSIQPSDPTLVIVPLSADPFHALVAVVPVRGVESRFLNDLNQPEDISSMLLDDSLRILSAEDRTLVGKAISQISDAAVAQVVRNENAAGVRVTREIRSIDVGGQKLKFDPAIVTLQPIDMPGGKRWWLGVSSRLDEVDGAVRQFFRRAIIGAAVIILVMTIVLVSTSTQMIRGRLRLERLHREMITRELSAAREIQLAWLPEAAGSKMPVDVAAMNKPASHVSGDFYNWCELPDGRAVMVVGDVTGHGLPAAFLMATTQLLVRMTIDPGGDPGAALRFVNRQLCSHVFSGQFVTMAVMVLDPRTNVVEIANAGHPPPLIGTGGAFEPLALKPQLVLAIDDSVNYETQRFELPPGASILLYTDGVTDVQSPAGERLTIEGLAGSLFGRFDSAASLIEAATDAIETFRVGREAEDDVTLVAVQLAPAPATVEPKPEPAAAVPAA